jgi:hypothetical protein
MGVKRHYNPDRAIHNRTASDKRAKSRAVAREAYAKALAKERDIGVDPIYWHGNYERRQFMRRAWRIDSREWDIQNSAEARS